MTKTKHEPPESDAIEHARWRWKYRPEDGDEVVMSEYNCNLLMSDLDAIADMIERDYVSREVYDSLKKLSTDSDAWLKRKVDELRAERDELKAMNERLQVALDAVEGCDERCKKLEAERDEWKAKAEGFTEALEKLGCSVLANGTVYEPATDLLTDDDGVTNLEWLYEHDYELAGFIDGYAVNKGYVGIDTPQWACEWLMAPHDCGQNADMSQKDADCVRSEPEMSENLGGDLGSEPSTLEVFEGKGSEVDTREKLEADVHQYANPSGGTNNLGACWEKKMVGFLDRQAAITKDECREDYKQILGDLHGLLDKAARERKELRWRIDYNSELVEKVKRERNAAWNEIDRLTANQPDSESVVQETGETAENDTAKCDIRDFDVDSREKLEADVVETINFWGAAYPDARVHTVLRWLDCQAAITERHWMEIVGASANCNLKLTNQIAELQDQLESAHAKNRALKAHISKMQEGRHGWHIKAAKLQDQVDKLTAECGECVYKQEFASIDELQEKVDSLTQANGDLRDEWHRVCRERDELRRELTNSNRERERLRKSLGIAIDHAHDMIALVSVNNDEGLA